MNIEIFNSSEDSFDSRRERTEATFDGSGSCDEVQRVSLHRAILWSFIQGGSRTILTLNCF